ncbi:MAG: glycogen debranching protein [Chitinophagaceae bacterium]|nr:glycogen debranching protein [Chitinophagaceae bacterium]
MRPVFFFVIFISMASSAQKPLYQSKAFSVYPDRVIQDKFEAKAVTDTKLTSNYESPDNLSQSANITFKFAINGKDNEMVPGQDHQFTVHGRDGYDETPVITFGKQFKSLSAGLIDLEPNTRFKVKLDMRDVLKQLNEKGFYTCYNGTKIFKEDFKGVFIAGATLPMTWDFDNLHQRKELQLSDSDGDGIYETEMILNAKKDQKKIDTNWELTKDISAFPLYNAAFPLAGAVYNMSIEEMIKAVEPDSTFRTGKEWAGVWTRDISYSIILSMSYLQPKVAMNSLLRKVNKKKRIIQDTGTGGAYPASTDRMIWATAAWEVYKATGDRDWLETAYTIIKNSIEDDIQNAYDKVTGMVRGESSFLDWRDQTYPKWMQPADIFESECLGTNAAHYQANKVLGEMAMILGHADVSKKHAALALQIKNGINKYLWMPDKGYYAQYLYGRSYKMQSPRAEALGEALCIIFGIADDQRAKKIIASVPLTDYGITCIYPQIPSMPAYHNNAVWPFVQAYWAQAAAKASNEKAVAESFFDIYRPAALFLTNKENYVADNGDFAGTVINSSNMLWSLSGNIAMVHKILFGIEFKSDRLAFHPFVPAQFSGKQSLSNFKYRKAVLDIQLEGAGNIITRFILDGKLQAVPEFPATLTGNHSIKIVMGSKLAPEPKINKTENLTAPATPQVTMGNGTLEWKSEMGLTYLIIRNGKKITTASHSPFGLKEAAWGEFQVVAVDAKGTQSFASEPVNYYNKRDVLAYEIETVAVPSALTYPGFSGNGFAEISKADNKVIEIPVDVPMAGTYAIDCRYANGNGPTNTENKCAIRELKLDSKKAGTFVFPQRGVKEWSNWGYSNAVIVHLEKGKHKVVISLEDYNDNMNGEINQAMLDQLRLTRLQ